MTKTDLRELISNGESSNVEFKRDDINSRQLAKELVALANFEGGRVLLGVDDDGGILGLNRPPGEVEEWVMTAARTKLRPSIIPRYEVVRDVDAGKHVAVVTVSKGATVYAVWHNQRRQYYIRAGTTAQDANHEELQRLFQQRAGLRAELRPVSGSSVEDLDERRLRDYYGRLRGQAIPENRDAWVDLLVNTEMMTDEDEPPLCTTAGMLLFGKQPKKYLPQAGITATAYPGEQKDYATTDEETLRSALVGLFAETDDSLELTEAGLVEQALAFVRRNTSALSEVDRGRRLDRTEYPMEAVREAIVNALVHRDYLLSATDIELAIYTDRLEIVSPGRLPNTITPKRMKTGTRSARNQLLKDTMSDYDYMEHRGLGVPRKIVKLMREHHGTEPDLVEEDGQFTVVLRTRGLN